MNTIPDILGYFIVNCDIGILLADKADFTICEAIWALYEAIETRLNDANQHHWMRLF